MALFVDSNSAVRNNVGKCQGMSESLLDYVRP